MRWSKFVHAMKINGIDIIFHALNKKIYLPNKYTHKFYCADTLPEIEYFDENTLYALLENEFVVKTEENESLLERNNTPLISLENLRILVTCRCNLKCSYCQIKKNLANQHIEGMPIDTAKEAIDWFSNNYNKSINPSITITGGEPFVDYEVTKFIIQYVNEKCPSARLTLFTNGTLIDAESARFLKNNNVFVIISIDGPEEIHNNSRVTSDGSNSFEMVFDGYSNLKNSNAKFGISAVMPDDYNDFIKMIGYFCTLKPLSVGINYKHQLLNKHFDIDFQEHGKRILQAIDLFNEHDIYFENYERYRKSFISDKLRTRECQSCGRGVTVDARGYIGTCKSLLVSDLNYCDFNTFSYANSKMVLNWASRTPLIDKDCEACYAISICGGGCAYDSYVLHNGNYRKCDKRICPFMKQVIQKLLSDSIKQQSNISPTRIINTLESDLVDSMIQSVGH